MSENSSPTDGSRTESIFYAALECPSAEERSRYVAEACGEDAALKASVTRLLQAHTEADETFLKHENLAEAISEADAQFAFLRMERPGDEIGAYRLVEQLGEGGFGVVWLAEQEKPVRRRVALKILKLGMDTREVIARFQAERQALAMMDHPNIARVFDAGATSSGRPYFVMELVQGTRITEYCDSRNLSPRARLELFIQVCHAVQHAHQKGIIHRDLKPSNILVTEQDGTPVPKVIDFGIAKATEQRLTDLSIVTQLEQMIGTPLYMSPEQAEQRVLDIDTRSDIYSLGVLLYELLTGRTPFSADDLMRRGIEEIRRVIREEEPERPSTALITMDKEALSTVARSRRTEPPRLITVLKGDLDWIVMRALEKDRSRRYQTASGLAEEIRRHLANEPVLAGPPSRVYRLKKLIRRNRLAFTAGLTIALTILAALTASTYLLLREREARLYAHKTLGELQATAPAFVEQARALVEQEEFESALEKLEYAAKLRPDVSAFRAAKGDVLQSMLRLSEAAAAYRLALALDSSNTRAAANAALCERLVSANPDPHKLSRESLSELYGAMQFEQRPSAELLSVARLLGKEKQLLMSYWLERLRPLPIPAEKPLEQRLSMRSDGLLALDLSGTRVSSLQLLKGMQLGELNCTGCWDLSDLSPLRGLPLRELSLESTNVYDITPLSTLRELTALKLSRSKVIHIEPLRGLRLELLYLDGLGIPNLSALDGMPLQELSIRDTRVTDLSPLTKMPLKRLIADGIAALDFRPLTGLPLERLEMRGTTPMKLDFLPTLPVKELYLSRCSSRSLAQLHNIKTLETLALPNDYRVWNDTERAALLALRRHPGIRYLGVELEAGRESGMLPPAENFWKQWDYEEKVFKPLRDRGVRVLLYIEPDGTWGVQLADELVHDLSSLKGAPITRLGLQDTRIEDLRPLTGLRLRALSLKRTKVRDLRPLAGMPLEELDLERTLLTDLSPLRGMPLKRLNIEQTAISDISALEGMPLQELWMGTTLISDLSPLKGMPLRLLHFDDCPRITDVSPVLECSTLEQILAPKTATNLTLLRALPHLRYISFEHDGHVGRPTHTAEEFWAMDPPTTVENLAREGRFAEMARLYEIRITNRNSSEEWKDFERFAVALLAQKRYGAYRNACAEMILRSGESEPAATLITCGLSPQALITPGEFERLSQLCVNRHPDLRQDIWYLLAYSLAKYRLGQFDEVVRRLENAQTDNTSLQVMIAALRAMALHHLGDDPGARGDLETSRAKLDAALAWPGPNPVGWQESLIAQQLVEEAEALCGKGPKTKEPK